MFLDRKTLPSRIRGACSVALLALCVTACSSDRLSGSNPDERALDAHEYGVRGDDSGIPLLAHALENDAEIVQLSAVQALGRIGTPAAIETMGRFLNHESRTVRIGLAQALQDVQVDYYEQAAIELVKLGEASLPKSSEDDPDLKVRSAVATSLAVLKRAEGFDFLLGRAINDYDENIRNTSVITLGRLKQKEAVDALVEIYAVDNHKNRAWAIEALGLIDDKRAIPTVIQALDDYDAVTRGKAAWALLQLQGDEARDLLEEKLAIEQDDMPAVVMAHALSLLGSDTSVIFLEDRVQRAGEEYARAEAARVLGDVGRRETVLVLHNVFEQDRDGLVKKEAGDSIRKLLVRFPPEDK